MESETLLNHTPSIWNFITTTSGSKMKNEFQWINYQNSCLNANTLQTHLTNSDSFSPNIDFINQVPISDTNSLGGWKYPKLNFGIANYPNYMEHVSKSNDLPSYTHGKNGHCQTNPNSSKCMDYLQSPISGVCILPRRSLLTKTNVDANTSTSITTINNNNNNLTNNSINDNYNNIQKPVTRSYQIPQDALKRLGKITNTIGDYICQLCFEWFPNAFALAEHPCSQMATLAYPCELCGKIFNCPANLASHQRWHKPDISRSATRQKTKRRNSVTSLNQLDGLDVQMNYINSVLFMNKFQSLTPSGLSFPNINNSNKSINNVFRINKYYQIFGDNTNDNGNNDAKDDPCKKKNFKIPEKNFTKSSSQILSSSLVPNTNPDLLVTNGETNQTQLESQTVQNDKKKLNPFSVEALLA